MKTAKIEVFGVSTDYQITSNSAEMNTLANRVVDGQQVDVAHDYAEQYLRYHAVNGDARAYIIDKIVALKATDGDGKVIVPHTVEAYRTLKTGEKKPYLKVVESEAKFVERAIALGAVSVAQMTTWLNEFATKPDYSWDKYLAKTVRTPGTGSAAPTKRATVKVEQWVKDGVLDAKVAALSEKLNIDIDASDLVAVARAYDAFARQYAAAAEAAVRQARAEAEQAI